MMTREQQIEFMKGAKERAEKRVQVLVRDQQFRGSVRRPIPPARRNEQDHPEVDEDALRKIM